MIYFISYDIGNPKRLAKIAKTLSNYGIRIQYSFFECEMEQRQLDALKQELLSILKKTEDSLHIYPVCRDCSKNVMTCGNGSIYIPSNFIIL